MAKILQLITVYEGGRGGGKAKYYSITVLERMGFYLLITDVWYSSRRALMFVTLVNDPPQKRGMTNLASDFDV